jgi:hypothetical protein
MCSKRFFYLALFFLFTIEVYSQNNQNQNELVDTILETYSRLNSWNADYEERLNELDDLLVRFFQSEASLSFDISTVLPFSSLVASDDGKVRVFSWFTENGGQAWDYHALIQYKTNSGVLKAELTKTVFVGVRRNDWSYIPGVEYNSIEILQQNIYLLFGGTRANSRGTIMYCFLAIELKDNTVFPYVVFNNKSYLRFFCIAVQPPNIEDLPGIVNMKPSSSPDTITLVYAQADDSKNIMEKEYHFIFNGKEFEGDYSILDR